MLVSRSTITKTELSVIFGFFKQKHLWLWLLYWVVILNAGAITSPVISCLQVNSGGDVAVVWLPSTDPDGDFQKYSLYADNGSGFVKISDFSSLASNAFTHVGANATVGVVSYYITVTANNSEIAATDTIRTIWLDVTNPANGTAILQWNNPRATAPSAPFNYFKIYKEFPAGVWNLVDSVANLLFFDTIDVCDEWINYRVELSTVHGCNHISNISGGQFKDLLPPNIPVIGCASVDTATGNVLLSWFPSTSPDAAAYIILHFQGAGWVILDTVHGYNDTSFLDLINVNNISQTYGVAAYDSCLSGNPPKPNTSGMGLSHQTMHLSIGINICDQKIMLNWTPYVGWGSALLGYEVFCSVNGGAYTSLGQLPASQLSFEHVSLIANANYCYFIKALHTEVDFSCFSNKKCKIMYQPQVPGKVYCEFASIKDEAVELSVIMENSGYVKELFLNRKEKEIDNFENVQVVEPLNYQFLFSDNLVNVGEQAYYYEIRLIDSCGNEALTSNVSRTILLRGHSNGESLVNVLQWNKYEGWDGQIKEYRIYRRIGGVYETTPLAVLPPSRLYYEDDIKDYSGTNSDGKFCYYIEAVEVNNPTGKNALSLSNEICVQIDPIIYVPNAIVIGGVNQTWIPVISLFDISSYHVMVHGRQGHRVFESADVYESWDGRYKGQFVQEGVYLYHVSFRDGMGKSYSVNGHITVIR